MCIRDRCAYIARLRVLSRENARDGYSEVSAHMVGNNFGPEFHWVPVERVFKKIAMAGRNFSGVAGSRSEDRRLSARSLRKDGELRVSLPFSNFNWISQ